MRENSPDRKRHTCPTNRVLSSAVSPGTQTLTNLKLDCLLRLYKGAGGYCSAYRGDVCRSVLPHDLLVFFNSSLSDPEDTQEYLVQSWWAELEAVGALCSPAVRSLLCHASFPDCNPSGLGPAPKPVCR